eukprot:13249600-Ditylum_brightwellii.AAC.1
MDVDVVGDIIEETTEDADDYIALTCFCFLEVVVQSEVDKVECPLKAIPPLIIIPQPCWRFDKELPHGRHYCLVQYV